MRGIWTLLEGLVWVAFGLLFTLPLVIVNGCLSLLEKAGKR